MTKEISRNHERPSTGPVNSGKLLKRLQWACAVRELTISLSSRNITEMEPCLPELPPLHVEDIKDSTLYSKVYDNETKLTLTRMFLSLTELTKLVVKIRLVKPSTGSEPNLARKVGDQIVESLFNIDRASLELSAWRDIFADNFSLVTTTSTLTNLKMLIFHRNLALLLCE